MKLCGTPPSLGSRTWEACLAGRGVWNGHQALVWTARPSQSRLLLAQGRVGRLALMELGSAAPRAGAASGLGTTWATWPGGPHRQDSGGGAAAPPLLLAVLRAPRLPMGSGPEETPLSIATAPPVVSAPGACWRTKHPPPPRLSLDTPTCRAGHAAPPGVGPAEGHGQSTDSVPCVACGVAGGRQIHAGRSGGWD